ncbi:MAG: hypothetical protein QOH82_3132 [Mycobacterium sp.]|nr:hypothetical protein [Mycobacterium sp.]
MKFGHPTDITYRAIAACPIPVEAYAVPVLVYPHAEHVARQNLRAHRSRVGVPGRRVFDDPAANHLLALR